MYIPTADQEAAFSGFVQNYDIHIDLSGEEFMALIDFLTPDRLDKNNPDHRALLLKFTDILHEMMVEASIDSPELRGGIMDYIDSSANVIRANLSNK